MRKLTLIVLLGLIPCCGCRLIGMQPLQPGSVFGTPQVVNQQPMPGQIAGQFPGQIQGPIQGYEQTFPPQQQPQRPIDLSRAGNFVGGLAQGFLRSAVGGAGFTAGRDLWNKIVR